MTLRTIFEGDLQFALEADPETADVCVYAVQVGDGRLIKIIRPSAANLRMVIDPRSIELSENALVLEFLNSRERDPYTIRGKQTLLTEDKIKGSSFGVETTKQHCISFTITDCATNIRFNVISRPETTMRGVCLTIPNTTLDTLHAQRQLMTPASITANAVWLVRLLKASCESDSRRDQNDNDVLTSDRRPMYMKLLTAAQPTLSAASAAREQAAKNVKEADEDSDESSSSKMEEMAKDASDEDVDDTDNNLEQRQQRQREKRRNLLGNQSGSSEESQDRANGAGDSSAGKPQQTTRPTYDGYQSRMRV